MTLDRYRTKFNIPDYSVYRNFPNNRNNKQLFTISEQNHYTSGGYDMIDDFNQSAIYDNRFPVDRVSGYTLKQLEQSLIGARVWGQWKDNIKNRYDNPTEIFLDELFNNWQD